VFGHDTLSPLAKMISPLLSTSGPAEQSHPPADPYKKIALKLHVLRGALIFSLVALLLASGLILLLFDMNYYLLRNCSLGPVNA